MDTQFLVGSDSPAALTCCSERHRQLSEELEGSTGPQQKPSLRHRHHWRFPRSASAACAAAGCQRLSWRSGQPSRTHCLASCVLPAEAERSALVPQTGSTRSGLPCWSQSALVRPFAAEGVPHTSATRTPRMLPALLCCFGCAWDRHLSSLLQVGCRKLEESRRRTRPAALPSLWRSWSRPWRSAQASHTLGESQTRRRPAVLPSCLRVSAMRHVASRACQRRAHPSRRTSAVDQRPKIAAAPLCW